MNLLLPIGLLVTLGLATSYGHERTEPPYLIVLGIAQDGGAPQAGDRSREAWSPGKTRYNAVCLAVVDPADSSRWLFEATPDFPQQLHVLDRKAPVPGKPGLSGIFLTHAHIGHYTGLMFLGHEVMGAHRVPVFAMPRMRSFLQHNGPWSQLVRYENIVLNPLQNGIPVRANARLVVTPFLVPHRQEYSEVVGFKIEGPNRSVLFIPDIDSWEAWDESGTRIEAMLSGVDVAYLDGTFYANGEIPGRDMSGFPHPFITHSMARFKHLPASEREKVHFIHLNHTNPALHIGSAERKAIEAQGFGVANQLEKLPL